MSYHSMFFDYVPDIYKAVQTDIFIARDVPAQCRQQLKWLQRNGYLIRFPDIFLEDARRTVPQYKIAEKYIKVLRDMEN